MNTNLRSLFIYYEAKTELTDWLRDDCTCAQVRRRAPLVPFAEGVLLAAGDSSRRRPKLPAIMNFCRRTGEEETKKKQNKHMKYTFDLQNFHTGNYLKQTRRCMEALTLEKQRVGGMNLKKRRKRRRSFATRVLTFLLVICVFWSHFPIYRLAGGWWNRKTERLL